MQTLTNKPIALFSKTANRSVFCVTDNVLLMDEALEVDDFDSAVTVVSRRRLSNALAGDIIICVAALMNN